MNSKSAAALAPARTTTSYRSAHAWTARRRAGGSPKSRRIRSTGSANRSTPTAPPGNSKANSAASACNESFRYFRSRGTAPRTHAGSSTCRAPTERPWRQEFEQSNLVAHHQIEKGREETMTTATATSTNQDKALREQLVKLLSDSEAHANFETAVKDLPADVQGKRPKGAAHSPWEMLEHLRIAQWDILEFARNAGHKSPEFPE